MVTRGIMRRDPCQESYDHWNHLESHYRRLLSTRGCSELIFWRSVYRFAREEQGRAVLVR